MGKVLIFDHNAREREKSASFLDKAQSDFKAAFVGLKAEFAAAKVEPDLEKRMAIYAGLEKKLQKLDKDSDAILRGNKRILAQLRADRAAKFEKLAGLISYGMAVGMIEPADKFILSCLADAKKAATDEEKEAFYDEAQMCLDDTYGDQTNG